MTAYAFKLKQLPQSSSRKEKDLPSIFADLIHMAENCGEKNINGEGLSPDLEATCFEYQRAQTQIDDAGAFIFISIFAIVAFHQVLLILHFSLCYSSSTRAVRLRNAKKELMFPLQMPVKKGIYLIFNYPW